MTERTSAISDEQVTQLAKEWLSEAKQRGKHFCVVPVWLMQLLIAKAERPHD